jgi:hypothetical protein
MAKDLGDLIAQHGRVTVAPEKTAPVRLAAEVAPVVS